jgi:hypothetical protein
MQMAHVIKHDFKMIKHGLARLSDSRLAIQIVMLPCRLPVLLRRYTLPTLLHRLTPRDTIAITAPDEDREPRGACGSSGLPVAAISLPTIPAALLRIVRGKIELRWPEGGIRKWKVLFREP